jgi:hypothetical protein
MFQNPQRPLGIHILHIITVPPINIQNAKSAKARAHLSGLPHCQALDTCLLKTSREAPIQLSRNPLPSDSTSFSPYLRHIRFMHGGSACATPPK